MPQKVCPRCSVLSDTDADTCPSCGAAYVRGGRRGPTGLERGAIAVAVLALAGAGAVFAMAGDDEPAPKAKATPAGPPPHAIVFSQAARIQAKSPYRRVIASLGAPRPDLQGTQERYLGSNRCIYYDVIDQPETDAQVCFRHGRVTVVAVNYPAAPPQDPDAKPIKPDGGKRQRGGDAEQRR